MIRLFLLLSIAFALNAQPVWFTALSASDDGQFLCFASPLILRGSNESYGMRAYRYSSAGFEPFATLADYELPSDEVGIDISSDASMVAWWDLTSQPTPGHPFSFSSVFDGELSVRGVRQRFNRRVALSRNGRYMLLYGSVPYGPPVLIDRETGAQYAAPAGTDVVGRYSVASTGQVMIGPCCLNPTNELYLWSPGATRTVAFNPSRGYNSIVLADDASRLFWADNTTLHMIETSSGHDTTLATFPHPRIRHFSVNRAGDLLAAVVDPADGVPPQLYLVRTDGSAPKLIAQREHGYRESALSGDGRYVFGSTFDAALVRIDTVTAESTEIVAPPPTIAYITGGKADQTYSDSFGVLVPGSQYLISGALLPDSVLLGKMPLQVLSSSPWAMRVQVPFDLPLFSLPIGHTSQYRLRPAKGAIALHFPSTSPFEQAIPVRVERAAPVFLGLWEAGLWPEPTRVPPLIVKGDFSGFVTSAAPGDMLVFYLAGLGAVSPAVPTAAPAPASPLALVTEPVSITLDVGTTLGHGPFQTFTPQVLFIGLAPGLVGVYQLTLKIPESLGLIPGDHLATLIARIGSRMAYTSFYLSIK